MTSTTFGEWLILVESKQNIVALGYPEIIAKLFFKRYGKHAYLLAKWYKDYRAGPYDYDTKEWFRRIHFSFSMELGLNDMITLYNATSDPEKFASTLKDLELNSPGWHERDPEENREIIAQEIEEKMFDKEHFFSYFSLVNDIIDGKLKDISPYSKLDFRVAQRKYDEKHVFQDQTPIKTYKNGWKWIDTGKRCPMMGAMMKNCGSAGVMSSDPDRTMIGLFDPNHKAHVVVTYSPNEKRISGDEGIGSSEVKSKYHKYILDLAQTLGVTFSADQSKSTFLKTKYYLQGRGKNIRDISGKGIFNTFYRFEMNGEPHYTDGNFVISKSDVDKVQSALKTGQLELSRKLPSIVQTMFHNSNRYALTEFGVNFENLQRIGN